MFKYFDIIYLFELSGGIMVNIAFLVFVSILTTITAFMFVFTIYQTVTKGKDNRQELGFMWLVLAFLIVILLFSLSKLLHFNF